ncbi:1,2-phenylacetyl-CoA epoxidase subunit PaaD [Myceligenerans salitolerans]|uniref:Phenylacetate-CoA oxygenase subunit PaaJ n=1 Tax=Myceligenerans salitolerans TaxID=1230528 RepID=A0ABS3I7Z8_9MICO|nr:1,2-phenylacetyl-CoA epoxidase subunit PaaD [Myceligenerans salitolerans]MBO0609083.1 phenylacetate-CoA oxygenase subunit PaaJ [Myceligenerans salitolerans]
MVTATPTRTRRPGAAVPPTSVAARAEHVRRIASTVVDPELPVLTLADLGVLRDVEIADDGAVVVAITPTYSGCPAMATMRDDVVRRLQEEGYDDVRVRVALHPAWTTDWITPRGRAALAEAGISPPGRVAGAATGAAGGTGGRAGASAPDATLPAGPASGASGAVVPGRSPVPLTLGPTRRAVRCPRCDSADVELTSEFGSTACKAMYRCRACLEPFDHVKEI